MPKAKELTSTQAAFIADYRNALTATAELEVNRLQAYRDLYMAGSLAVSAGVTYARGAKEAGVSVGTFAKHVFAFPLMPLGIEAWVKACETLHLDPVTLPHVLVGRAIDSGVSTDTLKAINNAVDHAYSQIAGEIVNVPEGLPTSDDMVPAIVAAVKALDRAAAAARKDKRDADAANNDQDDQDQDDQDQDQDQDQDDQDQGDQGDVTRQISASRPMIRKAAELLAAGAELPELAEWQGWKADVRALLDIVKSLDAAARKSA